MQWQRAIDGERLPKLLALAEAGVRHSPEAPEAWLRLGELQGRLGDDGSGASLDKALALAARDPGRLCALAADLLRLSQRDRALAATEAALALAPDDATARALHLRCLLAAHRYADAHRRLEAGQQIDVAYQGVLGMHDEAGLPPARMLLYCEEVLAAQPRNAEALFHKALALARLGRTEDARDLMALDRLIRVLALPAPPGFADAEDFRAALAAELLANPSRTRDPGYVSTRDGVRVTNLAQPGTRAVPALLRQVEDAVEAYAAATPDAPQQVRLDVWAVVLGADGFQRPHFHASGWLSGVYYVAAPRPAGANAYPGRLVVGAVKDERAAAAACWGRREIEPVPGRLVLFPSYIPHATEPSGIDADRISVAFDVIAVD
jgi:uncharacterized protein (TIGR02466 family)